jgi:ParB family chromosome partitioning protein
MAGFKKRTTPAEAGQMRELAKALSGAGSVSGSASEGRADPPEVSPGKGAAPLPFPVTEVPEFIRARDRAPAPVDEVSPEKGAPPAPSSDADGSRSVVVLPDSEAPPLPPPAPSGRLSASGAASGQRIVIVAVEDIRENPWNARRTIPSAKIEEYANSLKAHGQLQAAAAFEDEQGRVTLIDGHCRLRAAMLAGIPTLRVELRERPDSHVQLYLLSRQMNVERAEQTPLDDALAWRMLLDRGLFGSQAAIAKELALSEAAVSKTLSLAELPSGVIVAAIEQHELMALKPLYELYLFWRQRGDGETLELLAESSKRGGLSAREIEARRKALEKGRQPKPRSSRHAFTVDGVKGEIRRFEADGRLELAIKGLSPTALETLEERIAKLVSATPAFGG